MSMDGHEYQQRATEAQDHAWATPSDDLRARWLIVADAWLQLARDDELRRNLC